MRPVHLVGMGVIGSLLAWQLERRGVPWTWEDNESPRSAWRACTGCTYPSGSPLDMECLAQWRSWMADPPWGLRYADAPHPILCQAKYVYLSKSPPHGGKYAQERVGPLGIGAVPSMHFNAQAFVPWTRAMWEGRRVDVGRTRDDTLVVASNGFNQRLTKLVWGWTARAKLSFSRELAGALGHNRACIYMRKGRFQLAYAYPVPGKDEWYAGSSLIVQPLPGSSLSIQPKIDRWIRQITECSEGHLKVIEVTNPQEGWRPRGNDDDTAAWALVPGPNGDQRDRLLAKPMWHDGVRHAPWLIDQFFKSYSDLGGFAC